MTSLEVPKPTTEECAGLESCGVVSRETLAALELYVSRLVQWQRRINLIGPATIPHIWTRHIWDSAQLWPMVRSSQGPILDIGSGAGFPGLVLGILSALEDGPPVHLVESDGRKAAFLMDIISRTKARAQIHHDRVEQLKPWECAVVTARACAPLRKLIDYGFGFLGRDGALMVFKGQNHQAELTAAAEWWRFQSETVVSQTAPEGRILRLTEITPGSDRNGRQY